MKLFSQRLRRTSIRVRLIGLVLVPLLGLSASAAVRAVERHHTAVVARSVRADAALTSQLTQLSVVLDRELDVAAGFAQARQYGISSNLISDFLSYDLQTSLEKSRHALDEAFDGLEVLREDHVGGDGLSPIDEVIALRPDIDQVLAGMAADENTAEEVEALHHQLIVLLSQAIEEEIADLWTSQAGLEDAEELTAAIRTNEAAIDLVSAVRLDARTLSFYVLPAVRAEGSDPETELAVAEAQLQLAVEELERSVSPDLKAEFDRMVNSDGWIRQKEFRAQLASGEIQPVEVLFDEGGSSLVEAITLASQVYDTAVDRMAALTEFQVAANEQAVVRADELAEAADVQLRRSAVVALLIVSVAVAGAIITARSILASLSSLTARAQLISEGSLNSVAEDSVVPRDLEAVDAAFDDLTASLRAVDRQAGLLARGELDHAELDRTISGPLGESIHGSVEKLRQLTERLDYQANHDALTGLPNRAALLSALDRNLTGSVQLRTPCAVMLLDLDGFKQANDTLGHVIGDEVLCRVADRLRNRARGQLVGRLGGDEFMIIVEGDAALVDELAHGLLGAFTQPISSSAGTVWLSACIGMVEIDGSAWLSPSEVLQRVDVALYSGKSQGPGSLVVFDQGLHDAVLNQSALQARLRKALSGDELELHYQPVLSGDGRIGVEALLRWSPEGEAPIPPDVFIAAAEQSELILHIDEWVIDRACRQLAEWSLVPELAEIPISINISGRHVSSNQLPDTLVEAMQQHGINADRLIIEVTETELIPSIEQSIGVLAKIRALGIRLAIDDFGTGFASVAHLRRVQFDRIKIDRAFVSSLDDPTERSIATLLVSLGADLDLEVVAEGVETAEQASWAMQAGCTHLQGYYFARPMPAVDVAKILPGLRGRLNRQVPGESWEQSKSLIA